MFTSIAFKQSCRTLKKVITLHFRQKSCTHLEAFKNVKTTFNTRCRRHARKYLKILVQSTCMNSNALFVKLKNLILDQQIMSLVWYSLDTKITTNIFDIYDLVTAKIRRENLRSEKSWVCKYMCACDNTLAWFAALTKTG